MHQNNLDLKELFKLYLALLKQPNLQSSISSDFKLQVNSYILSSLAPSSSPDSEANVTLQSDILPYLLQMITLAESNQKANSSLELSLP